MTQASTPYVTEDPGPAADHPRARELRENGYALLPGVIDRAALDALGGQLAEAYRRVERDGLPFAGGTRSGHLNCFPGAESRFVYAALERAGVFDLVRSVAEGPLRAPNIGCNFNLPGSHEQNEHVDGVPEQPFWVVNVAVVDTTVENGAMEILCKTHRSSHEYWRLMLERPERRRVPMQQGDVLVRTSTLWHRGMPNRTATPRPMLAFTWEDGGSALEDPYAVHGGRITFLPNRYASDWKGRMREHAFTLSPRLGTAFLALRSLRASLRRGQRQ